MRSSRRATPTWSCWGESCCGSPTGRSRRSTNWKRSRRGRSSTVMRSGGERSSLENKVAPGKKRVDSRPTRHDGYVARAYRGAFRVRGHYPGGRQLSAPCFAGCTSSGVRPDHTLTGAGNECSLVHPEPLLPRRKVGVGSLPRRVRLSWRPGEPFPFTWDTGRVSSRAGRPRHDGEVDTSADLEYCGGRWTVPACPEGTYWGPGAGTRS